MSGTGGVGCPLALGLRRISRVGAVVVPAVACYGRELVGMGRRSEVMERRFRVACFREIPMERFATYLRGCRLALHGLVVVP